MAEQAAAEGMSGVAFRRFLKSVLVIDAILLLFLTFGFVLPGKPLCDPKDGRAARQFLRRQREDFAIRAANSRTRSAEGRGSSYHRAWRAPDVCAGCNPTLVSRLKLGSFCRAGDFEIRAR